MAKLFFVGDSITAGKWDKHGGWAGRLVGQVMERSMKSIEKGAPFWCVPYNLGVCGDTVPDLLRRLKRELEARTYGDTPDELVQIVFAIGVNDSLYVVEENKHHYSDEEFQYDMAALIKLAKTFTDNISFIGLLPPDEEKTNPCQWAPEKAYTREGVKHFDAMIEEMCKQESVAYLPLFDQWVGIENYKDYFSDGLHPNSEGHEIMAKNIGEFLFTDAFEKFHSSL